MPMRRPQNLLAEPLVLERLPGRAPAFTLGDPRPWIPGAVAAWKKAGLEPLPWAGTGDLLVMPWPQFGAETEASLVALSGVSGGLQVAFFEQEEPLFPNVLIPVPQDAVATSPAENGRWIWRSAFRQQGQGRAEAWALLSARRARALLADRLRPAWSWGASPPATRRWLGHARDLRSSAGLISQSVPEATWPKSKRVLALAPHFDDECLLFGSALATASEQGAEVQLIWLTDGGGLESRHEEGLAAAAELGIRKTQVLGLPESHLQVEAPAVATLAAWIADFEPDLVHLPWWGENHVDHFEAVRLAAAAWPTALQKTRVAYGSFWSALSPSAATGLPVHPARARALACHRSQLTSVDYLRCSEGLLAWNGRSVGNPQELHLLDHAAKSFADLQAGPALRRWYL